MPLMQWAEPADCDFGQLPASYYSANILFFARLAMGVWGIRLEGVGMKQGSRFMWTSIMDMHCFLM